MTSDFTGIGTSVMYTRMAGELAIGLSEAAVAFWREARCAWHEGTSKEVLRRLDPEAAREALVSGLRPSSARVYSRCLAQFLSWASTSWDRHVADGGVPAFLDALRGQGMSPATVRLHLAALKKILDELLDAKAAMGIPYPPAAAPRPPAAAEDVRRLYEAADSDRERLLLVLLNGARLRPGQIAALRGERLDFSRGTVAVTRGRKRRAHLLKLSDSAIQRLRQVIGQERPKGLLFPSARDSAQPITVRGLQKMLARMSRRCGAVATCTAIRRASWALARKEAVPASGERGAGVSPGGGAETARQAASRPRAGRPCIRCRRGSGARFGVAACREGKPARRRWSPRDVRASRGRARAPCRRHRAGRTSPTASTARFPRLA